jgi:hypothetical protein
MGTATRAWSSIAIEVRSRSDHDVDYSQLERWDLFAYGAGIAGSLLAVAALFGLANRLSGGRRVMFLIAAWVGAVSLVYDVAWPLLEILEPGESYRKLLEYAWRGFGALNLGAIILIGIAARAWTRSPLTIIAAIIAILAATFGTWLPYFGTWMFESMYEDHRIAFHAYYPVREALWSGALLVMVHGMLRDAAPPLPAQRIAITGFRTAGGALIGRVLVAVALALMGMGMVKSLGAIKLMLVIAPTITVLTTLVFAAGVLAVEQANLEHMPRVRLLLGAAFSTLSAGIQLMHVSRSGAEWFKDSLEHWTILGPIIGVVGIILVLSAIHSYAGWSGNHRLQSAAGSRATLYVVMTVIAVGSPFLLLGARDPSSLVVIVVLAAVCGIVGLIAVAGLLSLAADALGTPPELPQARIHK